MQPDEGEAQAQQQPQQDLEEERHILQARMDTADNLPLAPGNWQHEDAGMHWLSPVQDNLSLTSTALCRRYLG